MPVNDVSVSPGSEWIAAQAIGHPSDVDHRSPSGAYCYSGLPERMHYTASLGVVGFIGPEYLYDGSQIIRAGLEDLFCGKLLGLAIGCDVCYITIAFRFSVCPGKEATIFDRPPLNPLPWGGEEVSAVQ